MESVTIRFLTIDQVTNTNFKLLQIPPSPNGLLLSALTTISIVTLSIPSKCYQMSLLPSIQLVTGPAPPQSHSAWASRPRASTSPSPSTSPPTPTPSRWPFLPLATLRRQRPSYSLILVIQTWLRVISVKERMFERTVMPVLAGVVIQQLILDNFLPC